LQPLGDNINLAAFGGVSITGSGSTIMRASRDLNIWGDLSTTTGSIFLQASGNLIAQNVTVSAANSLPPITLVALGSIAAQNLSNFGTISGTVMVNSATSYVALSDITSIGNVSGNASVS